MLTHAVGFIIDITREGSSSWAPILPSIWQSVAEQALAEVLKVIDRLIDRCEQEDVPELNQRLQKRRAERDLLQTEVDRLRRRGGERSSAPPTREWIESQLQNLGALLSTDSPAAAHALRALIDGRIVVTEIREPASPVITSRVGSASSCMTSAQASISGSVAGLSVFNRVSPAALTAHSV